MENLIDLESIGVTEEEALELKQKSQEWLDIRKGKFTNSEFSRLVAECKRPMTDAEMAQWKTDNPKSTAKTIADPKLLSSGAMTFVLEVAGEILTGQSADGNARGIAIDWGIYNEPAARKLYEKVKGVVVREIGIVQMNDFVSGSPDGLVGDDGGIEIKCPFANHRHLENLMLTHWEELKEAHPDYYWQCIGAILINQRSWWDFVSYSPNFKGSAKLGIVRLNFADVESDVRLLAIKLKYAVIELNKIVDKFKEESFI